MLMHLQNEDDNLFNIAWMHNFSGKRFFSYIIKSASNDATSCVLAIGMAVCKECSKSCPML